MILIGFKRQMEHKKLNWRIENYPRANGHEKLWWLLIGGGVIKCGGSIRVPKYWAPTGPGLVTTVNQRDTQKEPAVECLAQNPFSREQFHINPRIRTKW